MNASSQQHRVTWHSSGAFVLVALLFVGIFGVVGTLLWSNQREVVAATQRLEQQTTTQMIRHQRLARNLEQLRLEGERVTTATTPAARRQAMLMVTLITHHPSVAEHAPSAVLAREVEDFLLPLQTQLEQGRSVSIDQQARWRLYAERLSQHVDTVLIAGIDLMAADLRVVSGISGQARTILMLGLMLMALFLGGLLFLLRWSLIRPLEHIDHVLRHLSVEGPAPQPSQSPLAEIQAVEQATVRLHEALRSNDEARKLLEKQANHDVLTGLHNRRYFMARADVELARAQRYRRAVTVGMADLDFFKRVNDQHGHAAGDLVLKECARLLQDAVRQTDLICRYGGEEFAFVFPESTLAEALQMAERFRQQIAGHRFRLPGGQDLTITISVGLAPADQVTLELALARADEALYRAKHQGRDQVVLWDSPRAEGGDSASPQGAADGGLG